MNEVDIGGFRFVLDLSKPLYEQVLNQIRSSIARGEIALGEKIPSVRELAQALKVTPNTVMRAYQELERERLTETRRGQGTFITTNADTVETIRNNLAEEAVQEFFEKMHSIGFTWDDIQQLIQQKGGRSS
ncbi:GntR family transcriptional regulator [Paenibacillus apiarius]|uniref:GntR family transcriptional regulator n=1 Tax=Paenibacillus apiarius TaxID=46240 RepID=UPI00197E4AA8|nr:GntR family transcriptional regulator [Paenibacillus apiarius]MBN3523497.1 GntR family transcriptional regulator [Paenibacillus apiarius]